MALVQQLPNGHLVLLLTPRESMMLSDQILEPGDYPWQGSESQMIAFEVKQRIKSALEQHLQMEVNVISQEVLSALAADRARKQDEEMRKQEEELREMDKLGKKATILFEGPGVMNPFPVIANITDDDEEEDHHAHDEDPDEEEDF